MTDHVTITGANGTVRWFTGTYGFITSPEVSGEIFVHYKAIEGPGYRKLYQDDVVVFTAVYTDKGWQARDVRRVR